MNRKTVERGSVAGTGADPTVEFAELEVGGTKYKLAYDFNAIAEAEALTQCNLLQGVAAVVRGTALTAVQLRGLLYAALHKAQPLLSLAAAGKLVRIDTVAEIREAIQEAYLKSLPGKGKVKDPTGAGDAPAG